MPPQVQPLPMSMAFVCSAPTKRAQIKVSPTLKAPVSVMQGTKTADPSCGCSMRTILLLDHVRQLHHGSFMGWLFKVPKFFLSAG